MGGFGSFLVGLLGAILMDLGSFSVDFRGCWIILMDFGSFSVSFKWILDNFESFEFISGGFWVIFSGFFGSFCVIPDRVWVAFGSFLADFVQFWVVLRGFLEWIWGDFFKGNLG